MKNTASTEAAGVEWRLPRIRKKKSWGTGLRRAPRGTARFAQSSGRSPGRIRRLLLLMTAVACGPNADAVDWKRAQAQNTVEEYQFYLARHTSGSHYGEARSAISQLRFHQACARDTVESYLSYLQEDNWNESPWRSQAYERLRQHAVAERPAGVRNIKEVAVEEVYEQGIEQKAPFREFTRAMLSAAGFVVAPAKAPERGVLRIEARGEGDCASYWSAGVLCTGARVSGVVTLDLPGGYHATQKFAGTVEPPRIAFTYQVGGSRLKPGPPFTSALLRSFVPILMSLLTDACGSGWLLPLVVGGGPTGGVAVDSESIRLLAGRRDIRAVEPLIAYLRRRKYVGETAEALAEIRDPRAIEPLLALLKSCPVGLVYEECKEVEDAVVAFRGDAVEGLTREIRAGSRGQFVLSAARKIGGPGSPSRWWTRCTAPAVMRPVGFFRWTPSSRMGSTRFCAN